jgi:hypothetical protein
MSLEDLRDDEVFWRLTAILIAVAKDIAHPGADPSGISCRAAAVADDLLEEARARHERKKNP